MQGVAYREVCSVSFVEKKNAFISVPQVQGSYYGEQEARLGYFPSSVVEETHALMPAEVEVKTNVCNARFFVFVLN